MKQWIKETIEEQLKLHKKQNKDDRYNYICEQFNPIWYCWELEKYTLQKDKEIEQLKNTIHEIEEYTHERIKLYKKRLKFPFYHPMRTLHNIWLYERYLNKIKKLRGGK